MKNLTEEIAKTQEIIKRKFNKLKEQTRGIENAFSKTYKPIIEPLEKIAHKNFHEINNNIVNNNNNGEEVVFQQRENGNPATDRLIAVASRKRKVEGAASLNKLPENRSLGNDENRDLNEQRVRSANAKKRKVANTSSLANTTINHIEKYARLSDEDDDDSFNENLQDGLQESLNENLHESLNENLHDSLNEFMPEASALGKEFFALLFNSSNTVDHTYGPYYDRDILKLGNKQIFLSDKIEIGNRKYDETRGLYELIFLKHPHNFSEEDVINYHEILRYTKANLNADGKPKSNRGKKYKNLVKPSLNIEGRGFPIKRLDNGLRKKNNLFNMSVKKILSLYIGITLES